MRAESRVASRLTGVARAFGGPLVRALGSTWRVRVAGREGVDEARRVPGPVLYVITHGALLPAAYVHRDRRIQVLVSESRDGETITRIIGTLGFGTVRGSSTRGGARAVVEMAGRGRAGFDLAVTPDGPRGPRMAAEPGAAVVAARSGLPVVPIGVGARRAWRARSWDRFLVPRPFAEVWIVYGPPLRFTRDDLASPEACSARLTAAMQGAEDVAVAYAEGSRAAPAFTRMPA